MSAMKNFKISVIIPVNDAGVLELLLSALKNQTYYPYEIIVVGNGGNLEWTKSVINRFKVDYVELKEPNRAKARNKGARVASGDILVFFDQDMIPCYGYLLFVNEVFGERGKGKVLTGEYRGIDDIGLNVEELLTKYDEFLSVVEASTWTFGANNVSYMKHDFEELGGFDEDYEGFGEEDIDLHWRMYKKGFKFCFIRNALVYHVNHKIDFEKRRVEGYKNVKRFWRKFNYDPELARWRKDVWKEWYGFDIEKEIGGKNGS